MTLYIGPIALDSHTNPTFQWGAESSSRGARSCSIGGFASWDQGKQLQELVDNPARLVTAGDASGVLEPIWPDDDKLAAFRGWYLLHRCEVSPTSGDEEGDNPTPFALTATRLPDGLRLAVARSARLRENDFDIDGLAVVGDPFVVSSFVVSPGGLEVLRQFDPLPHDAARAVAPIAEMVVRVGDPSSLAVVISCSPEAA